MPPTLARFGTSDDRYRRLQQLIAEYDVPQLPPLGSLTRPLSSPLSRAFRTPNDDILAEDLLKRRRNNAAQGNNQSGLRRAFTTTRRDWEPKEIFDTLEAHVANGSSPGVAEALIFKLTSVGGSTNTPNAKKRNSLLRKRSLETMEPSRILQKAVENRQTDMVSVLVQHADSFALDTSLPVAIRHADLAIVQLLLQHGANASQTQDGQDAFRQICSIDSLSDLVGLILKSDGRPSQKWASKCMVDAASRGCMHTVLRLSQSTADGNYKDAAALKVAVTQGRVDIALAILTGNQPPSTQGINEAFGQLSGNISMRPTDKIALAEALLCMGASGDVVSAALVQACEMEFYEMVNLLVSYRASVEYQDAKVLRYAISKGQSALVTLLLAENTSLGRTYASECVEYMPKNIPHEDRHAFLSLLLRKGAGGKPIQDALIDAVKAGDIESAKLLITPHFPGGHSVARDGRRSSSMVYERHEIASVDHRGGEALRIAVISSNTPMVGLLLNTKPSPETLAGVFSQIRDLSPGVRYQMAELFLATGLTGPCVSSALQEAVDEQPLQRDEQFIGLLLSYNVNVDANDGACVLSAVVREDISLLERLVKNRPSAQTAAVGILKAVRISDRSKRYTIIALLVELVTGPTTEVSEAMVYVLQTKPVDAKLLGLLLQQGKGDVNFMQGAPLVLAAHDPSPACLEQLLSQGYPSASSLVASLNALSDLPTTASKAKKLGLLLRRTQHTASLDTMLVKEVQLLLSTPPSQRTLTVLKSLLSSGANVNTQSGASLRSAIKAADAPISDLLFAARPDAATLAACLPHALHIADLMDRLAFTARLVEAGAPPHAANQALDWVVKTHPDDISLIRLLYSRADVSDGEALAAAIRLERPDIVQILLLDGRKRYDPAVLNARFAGAYGKVADRAKRVEMCALLLEAGAEGAVVSDALLAAAADGDTALGAVLLKGGADVNYREGKAILEACRAGAADVLRMLLGSPVEIARITLAQGFQAATQVGDLGKRADVFRLLLEKGVAGEVVDEQLVSAARFGEDGRGLVELLLEFGADVNYNGGEAVWTATRSAILGSLGMMLGVQGVVGSRQKKPNGRTVAKALKACWGLSREPRLRVVEWVFETGTVLTEEQLATALGKAVKGETDMRLVRLLIGKGARPAGDGCRSLIDAAQGGLVDVLAVFLEGEIERKDLVWTFSQAFTPGTVDDWLADQGVEVARMLLQKGARGDGLVVALETAIDAYGSDKDAVARRFVELLIKHDVDVDQNDGLVVQKAAEVADSDLIRQLLSRKPNGRSVSMAFPYIFKADLNEEELLQLITLFSEYHNGEERLDVMFAHPVCQPVLFSAIVQFPRSVKVLQALLDAGFYHDQMTMAHVMPDAIEEEEQVSLLFWSLLQPQKRVSDAVIELVINRGAKVNFQTRLSRTTPLMLAVQNKRKDLVWSIIRAGAHVDVSDATNNTPLTMATRIGDDIGTKMMSLILAAEPTKNDGSLHNAARELNLDAVRVLVDFGHDLDFPSPIHGGRSALGELCLNAAHGGYPLTDTQEKDMEKIMEHLIKQGTDLAVKSHNKSVLILALESSDPVTTTRTLLRIGMWKHINDEFNNYSDGHYVYSPTQYAKRLLPVSDTVPALLELLYANRAEDMFYALTGPQPDGATLDNLPEDIRRAERERKACLERLATDEEDHRRALGRTKEEAQLQEDIFKRREELKAASARKQMDLMRDQDKVVADLAALKLAREQKGWKALRHHEEELAKVEANKVKLIGEREVDALAAKHTKLLDWEKQASAARLEEKREWDKWEERNNKRFMGRIAEQKRLVQQQDTLASRLVSAGMNQRQIGFVTGEAT